MSDHWMFGLRPKTDNAPWHLAQDYRLAWRDPYYWPATCWNYECGETYRPTTLEQKYCTRTCKSAANQIYRDRRKEETSCTK